MRWQGICWTICDENNRRSHSKFSICISCPNFTYSWRRKAGRTLAPLRPASPRAWNGTLVQIAWSCLVQTRTTTSSVCRVSCYRTRSCLRATATCQGARLPATPSRNLERIRKLLINDFLSKKSMEIRIERCGAALKKNLLEVSCSLVSSNQLVKSALIFWKAYVNRNYFIAESSSQKTSYCCDVLQKIKNISNIRLKPGSYIFPNSCT